MSLATCPSSKDLERLCLGKLPEDDAVALEKHVQECRPCLERLIALLPAHDTLSDAISGRDTLSTPASAHPLVAELIRKLEKVPLPTSPVSNPEVRMLTFNCSSCQKKLSVKETLADKKVKCPGCGAVMAVPVPVRTDGGQAPAIEGLREPTGAQSSGGAPISATNPSLSKPDATLSIAPDSRSESRGDSRLTDFLAPPQADDEIGRLGIYRILKILGHGGMGVVFLGEDPALNRKVAIKAMLPQLAQSKSSRQRFIREAQTAAALEHDHIVTIHQVGEDRGAPYLVMPLLKGEPLDERLKREPVLPLRDVLRIGRETAEGLAAAHANGLIHRDIKPANIWLEVPRDRVKILDFGLARAVTEDSGLTQQGAIIGTPAYMSPEQARGASVDARSDLFSLGVVLYRMSTGKQPFQGIDTVSTLVQVAIHEPAPPMVANVELPQELSDLVMKLLEKDSARRIASAGEVIAVLQKMEDELRRQKEFQDRTHAVSFVAPTKTIASAAQPASAETKALDSPAPRRRGKKQLLVLAVLFLGGLIVLAGGIAGIIRIATPEGDYVIDTDDPDFAFSVSKGTVVLDDKKAKRTYNLKVLKQKSGEFDLEITDPGNELAFNTKKFSIKRGEKVALKAWFERKGAELAKGGAVDDAWIKMVASLPAEKQVEAVKAELMKRNPGFDGKIENHKIEGGAVTELAFRTDNVTDIAPFQALTGLRKLRCGGSKPGKGRLADLTPLKDIPLTVLQCYDTQITDLSPLKQMPLVSLNCNGTGVSDLSPLSGLPMTDVSFGGTPVADMTPLKDMKLVYLDCNGTKATDLSLLRGMPLKTLFCTFKAERDAEILRSIKTLEKINGKTAAEFWREVDVATNAPHAYALSFNGKSSHVKVSSFKYEGNHPLTLEAWVVVGRPGGDPAPEHLMGNPETSGFAIDNGGGTKWAFSVFLTNANRYVRALEKEPLPRNRLLHVAGIYDGKSEVRFYVDGKLQSRESAEGPYRPSPMDFTLGANPEVGGVFADHFLGRMQGVRISKVARYDKDFTPAKRFDSDRDTLALYHFEEGKGDVLNDSSGNNHHGKIVGAKWVKADGTPINTPPPTGDYALAFEKIGDLVEIDSLKVDASAPFTLEAYATIRSGKEQHFFGSRYHSGLGISGSGRGAWGIFAFGRASGLEGPPSNHAECADRAALGKMTHVAGTFSGSTLKLFIDGKLVKTIGVKGSLSGPNKSPFRISSLSPQCFDGFTREFRISKVARYDKNFTPAKRFEPDKDTVALYHCDEGSGDVLKDSSGNNHHGKIVGAKWVKADGTPIAVPGEALAVSFDRYDDGNFRLTKVISDESTSFTLEGWYWVDQKATTLQGNMALLGQSGNPYLGLNMTLGGKFYFGGLPDGRGTNVNQVISNTKPIGRWAHLAGVGAGNQYRLFVDGKIVAAGKMERENPLRIHGGIYVVGRMKEIRISKIARYDKDFTPDKRFEPDKDTVALYHCDEGSGDVLKDSSGNRHHGKIVGAKWVKVDGTPIAPKPPAIDYALQFPGGSRVELPDPGLDVDKAFTLEAFVRAEKLPLEEKTATWVVKLAPNQCSLALGKIGNWNFMRLGIPASPTSSVMASLGKRIHLAGVYDGGQLHLFVDGERRGTNKTSREDSKPKKTGLTIGDSAFVGLIDQVHISKVARYTKDFTPTTRFERDADTLSLYHFGEGSGDVLKDSSGNNHHGKIVGARWVKPDGTPIAPLQRDGRNIPEISDRDGR